MRKQKMVIKPFKRRQFVAIAAAATVTGGFGLYLTSQLRAATFATTVEAETGTVSNPALSIDSTGASGGKAVKFGPSGTTPDPTPENTIVVSPSGNDTSGNGSASAPYKTFTKAISAASAGTTVYARTGVYNEKFEVTKSGMAGKPIVISSYPGEKAEVVGGTSSFYNQGIIMLKNVSYVTVQNMTFRDIGGDGTGVVVQDGNNVTIKGNTVYNIEHAGIDVNGDNILIDSNEVYNSCLTNSAGKYNGGGWPPALTTKKKTSSGASSTNIDINNNYVHDNWGEGIDTWFANGGTVSNNRAINNYSVNLYTDDSSDVTIINNTVQSTNDAHNTHEGNRRPHGLVVANELQAFRPKNMIINGNIDAGGHSDGIVWHDYASGGGVKPLTQSPNPQNMP